MATRFTTADYKIISDALVRQREANRADMQMATQDGDFDRLQQLALDTAKLEETQTKVSGKLTNGAD